MYTRILVFLTGFGFMLLGLFFIIAYLNLTTIGFTFEEYIHYILHRKECWMFPFGFLLTAISIYYPERGDKNDVHL